MLNYLKPVGKFWWESKNFQQHKRLYSEVQCQIGSEEINTRGKSQVAEVCRPLEKWCGPQSKRVQQQHKQLAGT